MHLCWWSKCSASSWVTFPIKRSHTLVSKKRGRGHQTCLSVAFVVDLCRGAIRSWIVVSISWTAEHFSTLWVYHGSNRQSCNQIKSQSHNYFSLYIWMPTIALRWLNSNLVGLHSIAKSGEMISMVTVTGWLIEPVKIRIVFWLVQFVSAHFSH